MDTLVLAVPPPGTGLLTTTATDFATDKSELGIFATIWLEVTDVTAIGAPATLTLVAAINPDPVRVTSVSLEPAGIVEGDTAVTCGDGLEAGGGGVFVALLPPPQPAIHNRKTAPVASKAVWLRNLDTFRITQ
jgi:hypothetical protein